MEALLFPEWRNENRLTQYPFADDVSLTNGSIDIPRGLFLDAKVYPVGGGAQQFLSRITISLPSAELAIGDGNGELAAGTYVFNSGAELIKLFDGYGRAAGVLLCDPVELDKIAGWGLKTHEFAVDQTAFVATVVVPTPEPGVRGLLLEDGSFFANVAWLFAEGGIYLTVDADAIRVDIVGDARAVQSVCDPEGNFDPPIPLQTLSGIGADAFGDFKLLAGSHIASDTVLRIEGGFHTLILRLAGTIR